MLFLLLAGCVRAFQLGSTDTQAPDGPVPDAEPTQVLVTVCQSGCDHTKIDEAIAFVTSMDNPKRYPIVIEVRDSRSYVGNLSIAAIKSGVSVELRGAEAHPVIIGENTAVGSGRPGGSAITIDAPNVTVGGFMFKGTSHRAISVSAPGVTLHHNAFTADFKYWDNDQYFRATCVCLMGRGTEDAYLFNNTFHDCQESFQIVDGTSGSTIKLRNNVFVQLSDNHTNIIEPIIWIRQPVSDYALDFDYNLYYYTGAEAIAWVGASSGASVVTMKEWQALGLDPHGVGTTQDPGLFNPLAHDFHLLSAAGRYDPATEEFVLDGTTSPAIDAGDPTLATGGETMPNGGRVNLGCFGGTKEASRSN